jgi:hypothetical protein
MNFIKRRRPLKAHGGTLLPFALSLMRALPIVRMLKKKMNFSRERQCFF